LSLQHVERVIVLPQTELIGDASKLDDSAQPQPWDAQAVAGSSG
jgi:hypothetical protein